MHTKPIKTKEEKMAVHKYTKYSRSHIFFVSTYAPSDPDCTSYNELNLRFSIWDRCSIFEYLV